MSSPPARGLPCMSELRVHNFSVSLDGYGAGAGQGEDDPLGVDGELLHEWIFADDASEVDRRFRARGDEGIGATIMGRNMFGPVRGTWGDRGVDAAGGARTRRSTTTSSCSPTTPATGAHGRRDDVPLRHRRHRGGPRAGPRRRRRRTSGWAEASRRCSSTCAPDCSTRSTSPSSRSCSAAASGSSTDLGAGARGMDAAWSSRRRRRGARPAPPRRRRHL